MPIHRTVSQDTLIGMHLVVDLLDNRPLAKAMAGECFSSLLYQSIEKGSVVVYELYKL
jgi:hypothetical protein